MPKASGSNRKSGSSPNLKIGILLGGSSPEREVSLRSGKAVQAALQSAGYQTFLLDPAEFGKKKNPFREIDAAFVALHGAGGEDGIIQKKLEALKIPYTGSNPEGCRLSIHKHRAKNVFRKRGIPTPESRLINQKNWRKVLESFPAPFFVKPPEDGSSLGIFKVENLAQEQKKILKAVKEYGELLVERKVTGREFTVGVLEGKALPVVELRPRGEFYDYKSKYTAGGCQYLVPAPISRALTNKLQRLGVAVHKALKLRDLSRSDILVDEKGQAFVLEANAIPGFTEFSLVPKAAAHAGIPFPQLCERLLRAALKRGGKARKIQGRKRKG